MTFLVTIGQTMNLKYSAEPCNLKIDEDVWKSFSLFIAMKTITRKEKIEKAKKPQAY